MSKKEFEDDGRTVFDMSYTQETTWYENFSKKHNKGKKRQSLGEANIVLTKQETKSYIFSALLAGLTIGLIFIGAFYLFILFCIYVWFQ